MSGADRSMLLFLVILREGGGSGFAPVTLRESVMVRPQTKFAFANGVP